MADFVKLDGEQARWLEDIRDAVTGGAGSSSSGSNGPGGSGGSAKGKSGMDRFQGKLQQIQRLLQNTTRDFQRFNDYWAKVDHAASQYTKTLGGTAAALEKLRKQTINTVVKGNIGIEFNVSMEELLRAQQQYVQGVGRALRLDQTQQTSLAAMSSIMGGEGAARLSAAFENFGVSLNGTANHVGRMWKEAAAAGISFEKYSENVRENITIAQNYTFKNGLRGLESMAKKATAIKMDMKQIESFANKVNTIEGSIEASAKLQVLGGPFANMADPLGMLNEGLMDMEGLMDRVTRMVGGLGSFNKATGEVTVSAFNKARIRAAAEAMGMDYSQLMTSINAQAKRGEIEKQIRASGNPRNLNEKMLELFKNSATFNEKGVAGVSINGQFKTLNELQNSDYEELVKETQDESADIKDIARSVRSLVDKREGFQKQWEATKAEVVESLGTGEFEGRVLDTLGNMHGLLKAMVYMQAVNGVIGLFKDVKNLFKGAKSVANGISRMAKGFKGTQGVANGITRTVGGTTSKMASSAGLRTFSNVAGKTYTMDAAGRVFNAAGTRLSGAAATNAMRGATFAEAGAGATAGAASTVANTTSKLATAVENFNKFKAAKFAKVGGVLAGVTEGVFTGIDEFSGNKNYGTAKKVGRTAGAATGGGLGAWGGAAAGAAIGSVIPGIGNVIGGLIGGAIGAISGSALGKWIGGGFASQERREKWKKKLGLTNVKGDYSVKKLKKIEKALYSGEISDSLRQELLKKGDNAIVEQIKAVKKEKNKSEGGEGVEKNIQEAYFTVENAYFGDEGGAKGKGAGFFGKKDAKGSFWQDMKNSLTWGPFAGMALLFKRWRRALIRGHEERGSNALVPQPRNKFADPLGMSYDNDGPFSKKPSNIPTSMTITVNGTIKLTDAQGKSLDITGALLKDSVFVKDLARLISKELKIDDRGTNVVEKAGQ